MVSPSYSQQRSEMAKSLGLGQLRRKGLAAVTETDSLKVEAFDAVAESGQGEAARDDEAPAEAATESAGKRKRAGAPRTRKPKAEPATA